MIGFTRRHKATSLIEVVMAMVILGIALPPLMIAFTEASMQSIEPSRASVASFLATERMEEIVARRFRDTSGYAAVNTTNFGAENPVTGFPFYDRSVTVTFVDAALNTVGSDQGYKKVRVTVSWNGGADEIRVERIFADF